MIGGGESAFDIGHLCLKYTNKLYYTTKNYVEWFPEWGKKVSNRCSNNYLPSKNYPINKVLKTMKLPPQNNNYVFLYNDYPSDTRLTTTEYSLPTPMSGLWHRYGRFFLLKGYMGAKTKCVHNYEPLCNITKTPDGLFHKYVVKRTPFFCDLHDNKVNVVNYPINYVGNTIKLKNNKEIKDIDIIICATGYKKEFTFLDSKFLNDKLIKKIISTKNNNLAFIGFARPTMGSLTNVAEMQSWWASLYFKNKLNYKFRNYSWARPEDPLNLKNNFISTIVIGIYYYKDLALDMGIYPNMIKLFFTDFPLWKHIMSNSVHPTLFRLEGRFKHKDARKNILNTLPLTFLNTKKYLFGFLFFHLIFIVSIILIVFIIFSLSLKNKISMGKIICLSLLFGTILTIYLYQIWH